MHKPTETDEEAKRIYDRVKEGQEVYVIDYENFPDPPKVSSFKVKLKIGNMHFPGQMYRNDFLKTGNRIERRGKYTFAFLRERKIDGEFMAQRVDAYYVFTSKRKAQAVHLKVYAKYLESFARYVEKVEWDLKRYKNQLLARKAWLKGMDEIG